MSAAQAIRRLVVTDLDGSLLDHHSYDYAPAEPAITALEASGVPLVLASLVTGVASLADLRKLSRIGGKTIAIYLSTTCLLYTSPSPRDLN